MHPLPSLPSGRLPRSIAAEPADRHPPPETGQRAWPRTRAELTTLVEDCAEPLVWHAFRLLGSMPDAEDVVQDVFVRVFAAGQRDEVASVRAYLHRAVGNACTDFLRSRSRSDRRRESIDIDRLPTGATARPTSEALEERARIQGLLGRLPRDQAEAIRLRVFDGLQLDEISEVLDCPINTVSSRLRYGFQKLREAVGREGAKL